MANRFTFAVSNPINNNPRLAETPVLMPPESASTGTLQDPAGNSQAKGLRGITAADSSVSFVDGENGRLLYRGYEISELAERSTFEEASYLLLHGELPTREQLKAFKKELAEARKLPTPVLKWIKQLPTNVNPMTALRSAVSQLGVHDAQADSIDDVQARRRVATRIIAQTATIAAALHRVKTKQPVVAPRKSGTHASNFLRMFFGKDPDDLDAKAMDVALILHADHEFNASTFAARVTISTLSDPYSAVTSALGALKGPLHGGANRAVMRQLEEIASVDRVESWTDQQLSGKKKIMGFGHAVYRTMDPRALVLRRLSEENGRRVGDSKWYELSRRLEAVVHDRKGLFPNVDFYSASLYHTMKIPREYFPTLFAASRVSGWLAHIDEQLSDNKLIRPNSRYVGPDYRKYVTAGRRS